MTPYLLAHVVEQTGGRSLAANIALVRNNATFGCADRRRLRRTRRMRRALIVGLVVLAGCGSGAATRATPTTTTTRPSTTTAASDDDVAGQHRAADHRAAATATTTIVATHGPTVADLLTLGRPVVLAHTGGEDEFPGSTMYVVRREREGRRRHARPERAC